MKKILGIGNALVDILMKIGSDHVLNELKLPKGSMQLIENETAIEIEEFTKEFSKQIVAGGSAANTINGLARLGVDCGYVGKIGDDLFGKLFKDNLEKNKIQALLFRGSLDTGRAYTFITKDGERTFGTFLGSAVQLNAGDFLEDLFKSFDYLHVEGYLVFNHELIERVLSIAKSAGVKISMDMASYNVVEANLEFLKGVINKYVDIVFANEEEAKALTGEEPAKALDTISQWTEIAVVKVGEKGSLIKSGDKTWQVNSVLADCIDTTGAGDLYAAGFLFGLVKGYSLDICGKIGSILGGNVIEVIGATMENGRWEKINSEVMAILK